MTAATGIYNSKAETLKLDRDIVLTSSTGYAGHLSEAMIDIRKGHVVSEQAGGGEDAARHARRQPAGDRRFRRSGALRRRRRHDADAQRAPPTPGADSRARKSGAQ